MQAQALFGTASGIRYPVSYTVILIPVLGFAVTEVHPVGESNARWHAFRPEADVRAVGYPALRSLHAATDRR